MSNLVKKTNQKKHITQNQRKQREEKERRKKGENFKSYVTNFTTA